jgi:hypothetical protein
MGSYSEEVGALPLNIGQYAVSTAAATTITMPTALQRKKKGGLLTILISVEAQNHRLTIDGSTPTAATGILFTPGTYTFRGEQLIKAMQWITAVAGGQISYGFYVGDTA